MYNSSGGGEQFRRYNSVNLAWWHTCKHATKVIWRTFAKDFLAPWWHSLYPGGQFHKVPGSYPMMQTHLLILHTSYPHFKDQLASLQTNPELGPHWRTHLQDLQFLFEFAIPTVSCSSFSLVPNFCRFYAQVHMYTFHRFLTMPSF